MHNCARLIREQLGALASQGTKASVEIVVVDDASTDGSAQVVREWVASAGAPDVRLVEREFRGGANAARNAGVSVSRADFLLFCDGDDVVGDGWIAAMLEAKIEDWEILAGEVIPFVDGQSRTLDNPLRPLPPRNLGFEYGSGGNMGMPRALYDAMGGFDENVFRGGTELEFAIRAQVKGLCRVRAVPGARIHYRRPAGLLLAAKMGFQQASGRAYIERKFGSLANRSVPPLTRSGNAVRLSRILTGGSSALERRDAVQALAFRFGRFWWRLGYSAPARLLGFRHDPADAWARDRGTPNATR